MEGLEQLGKHILQSGGVRAIPTGGKAMWRSGIGGKALRRRGKAVRRRVNQCAKRKEPYIEVEQLSEAR